MARSSSVLRSSASLTLISVLDAVNEEFLWGFQPQDVLSPVILGEAATPRRKCPVQRF